MLEYMDAGVNKLLAISFDATLKFWQQAVSYLAIFTRVEVIDYKQGSLVQ